MACCGVRGTTDRPCENKLQCALFKVLINTLKSCICVATPVVTDAISVKRLRHGGAVELKWRPSASDGTGLILYVLEGISINSDSAGETQNTHWTLITRVCTLYMMSVDSVH